MRVQIAARHCDVPDVVRTRVTQRLEGLKKYDRRLSAADVVFQVEKHVKKVEAILSVDGDANLVGHGEGDDFRAAVDRMVDRLARRLRRRRSQRTDHQPRRPTAVGEEPTAD